MRSSRRGHRLAAVNSINWARIAAQIVYYFKGYFAVARDDGEEVDFAVALRQLRQHSRPATSAKAMGLPIRRLILANQRDDVLDEFLQNGTLSHPHRRRDGFDIEPVDGHIQASTRSVRLRPRRPRSGRRARALASGCARRRVRPCGTPVSTAARRSGFVSGKARHADRLATIGRVAERHGVVVDPHTPTASR